MSCPTAIRQPHGLVASVCIINTFLRILEKAVALMSTNCCSLFKSPPNCWKPSSSAMKLAESLGSVAPRLLRARFLSVSVLRRSLSCGTRLARELPADGSDLLRLPFVGRKH